MIQGPPNSEKENVDDASVPFRLSHIVTSPTSHKTLTSMPSAAVLDQLNLLRSRALAGQIKRTLIEIYSYVTQRVPDEGADHFFIHVGATVHYENFNNCFIKGRDHAKKAAVVVNNIQATIKEMDLISASPQLCNEGDPALLTLFKNLLIVHKNAIYVALKNTNAETKAHIKTFMGIDTDACELTKLSPEELALVISCYPPNDEKRTPKRRTRETQDSIKALGAVPPFPKEPKSARKRLVLGENDRDTLTASAASSAAAAAAADDDNTAPKSAAGRDSLESLFASIAPPSLTWAFSGGALPASWRDNANNDDGFDQDDAPDADDAPGSDLDSDSDSEGLQTEHNRIVRRRGKFFK